jgi:hypothetical protein
MPKRHGAFARKTPRAKRARAGRTRVSETPLDVRVSGVEVPDGFGADARALLGRRLGRFATHIERATVRLEDINGPRGGVDTVCRIQLTVSGRPPVLVARNAVDAPTALRRSATAAAQAMDRSIGRAGRRTPRPTHPAPSRAAGRTRRDAAPWPEDGSLVGRRVGRSRRKVVRAASRPEKRRRDRFIDTAAPGVSETDRKAGGGSSAARNTKLRLARMGYTLEDSAGKPSRKSTRKSANRAKSGSKLARQQKRRIRSPKARATRAKIQRQRGTRGRV